MDVVFNTIDDESWRVYIFVENGGHEFVERLSKFGGLEPGGSMFCGEDDVNGNFCDGMCHDDCFIVCSSILTTHDDVVG